jgi:Fungal protein kinase
VTRTEVDGKIQYKFEVDNESYITTKPLAESAANFILGRGTRVFEAYKESDPQHIVALKDTWIEDDRTPEGLLLETMKAKIAEMQAQGTVFPGSKDPSAYFLTVEAHGRVKADAETEDHTVNVMMRGLGPPSELEYFSTSSRKSTQFRDSRVEGSDRGYSVGHTPQISSDMAEAMRAHLPRKAPHPQGRIHYRIVFSEVGRTIHDLRQLSHVYQCLSDVTIGVFSCQVS